jgi:oligopeptidase B
MKSIGLAFFALFLFFGCSNSSDFKGYPQVEPPVAEAKPTEIVAKHGHTRIDPYYWLNEKENPNVIDYLKAENAYLDTMLSHTQSFQEALFTEMRSRIKEDDSSLPYLLDDYYYYSRFEEGGEYAIYCRKKGSLDAAEEIILDGNQLGADKSFFNFYISVSPDHQKVAVMMDTIGRNFYTIMVKDLITGEFLNDQIDHTRGGIQWINDNQSFFYSVPDPITLRQYLIMHHHLGQNQQEDKVVYEEKDETLSVYLGKTRSKKFITLTSGRTDATKVQFMSADQLQAPQLIQNLQPNVNYDVDHVSGDEFLIFTNKDAVNYKIVKAPINNPTRWTDFIAHRPDVFLQGVTYFKQHYVLEERAEGQTKIQLIQWNDGNAHYLEFDEPAYYAGVSNNPEFNSTTLRFVYTSMTTPSSTFDYNMDTREKKLMKEQPVLGDFDKNNYATERIMVPARDGKQVPMSIVYRKDKFKKDGSMPGWIYGYGSYGSSMEATFNSNRISLLDRGFVYAIAHIRGGQEMGGEWYEDGKMLNKKNTFYDFIDCSKWLQDNQYVAKDKLFASGGSAGGLLIGAVVNMAPELYRGVIAAVPFVDVITTMMDEAIPLTTFEWLEWGNPNIQEQYEYMLSYSPYDNVESKAYPHMLVTTGLHDSQVQYWEPAKWVALLRTKKTDQNNLFFYTNLDAGHGGASGRFRRLKEIAREYAFVFDILNIRS